MSVSDSWGRDETWGRDESWGKGEGDRRRSADRGASDRRLADLAERLAEARRAGDPAPEELERLVELLATSDIDPGDRLTRALEGFADLSEERRAERRSPRPDDNVRAPAGRRVEDAAPPRSAKPDEIEARLADFARTLPAARAETRSSEQPARRPDEPAPARATEVRPTSYRPVAPRQYSTPPIASLRSALAEIAARQKALDEELQSPARRDPVPAAPNRAEVYAANPLPAKPLPAMPRARDEDAADRTRDYAPPRPAAPGRAAPVEPPAAATRAYEPTAAARKPAEIPASLLNGLRSEIDRLGNSVADLPTRTEIDRMTREMSDLARKLTEDRPSRLDRDSLSAIDRLVTQVDRMRAEAASPQMISKLAEELHAISVRLDVLGPRNAGAVEVLARRIEDVRSELEHFPRASSVDGVAAEIQRLIVRLDAQESAVAPTREAVVGLAGHVQALDGRIAAIADAAAARDDALGRINATILTELDALPRAQDVSDLGRQIDALTEGLRSRSAIGPALKAVEGLTGKVEALDDKIAAIASHRDEQANWLNETVRDEIAAVARPEAFDGLSRQIEALTHHLANDRREVPVMAGLDAVSSRIERLTEQLADERRNDDGGAKIDAVSARIERLTEQLASERRNDDRGAKIDAVSARIERLTEQLANERRNDDGGAKLESITTRIADLGERFDSMAADTRARGAVFEQVEESIRSIAEQLVAPRAPAGEASNALESEVVRLVEGLSQTGERIEDLHEAFSGIAARIERSCADLGAHAAESAVAAARELLGSETGGGRLESELASALSELRASSAQSERRAADALDAVRSTLERLLDRMENQPAPAYAEAPEPRRFGKLPEQRVENATEMARAAARRAMEEIADAPPPPAARVPHIEDAPAFRPTYGDFGPDEPIEPGAGAPRAEAQSVPPVPHSAASLIASARRAKQQSEPEAAGESADLAAPAARGSLFGGALSTFKRSKRPILLGVAAVLIVFTALYVASGMTGDAEDAPAPAPQSQLAPVDEHPALAAAPAPTPAEAAATEADAPEPAPEERAAEAERSDPPAAVEAKAPAAPEQDRRAEAAEPARPEPARSEPVAAPRAPARDLTGFAFSDAGAAAAAAKSRADWKVAEPASTGSVARDPNAIPDQIGGATLKSRAKAGDPAAEVEVGDRLLDGRNVAADASAAARWFAKAAAQGSAPAQHRLGSLYEKGRGVPRDVAAARRWYEQAAASGNVRAMHNLGVVHAEGGLGKPDYAAAMVWFRMAAERGLTDSGYNLAVLAARGLGGKRDLVEAYKWFALAAQDGDQDAAKKRDEVGKALGKTLPVAQTAVAEFKAKPVDPAANDPEAPPGGWDRVASREHGDATAVR